MDNQSIRDVFSTGEVARLCSVAPRTVSKWFDSGKLTGYRIPGSLDRRVPLASLLRFCQEHSIPHVIEKLGMRTTYRALFAGVPVNDLGIYRTSLDENQLQVVHTSDAFGTGQALTSPFPQCVVWHCSLGFEAFKRAVVTLWAERTLILFLAAEDEGKPERYVTLGADVSWQQPVDPTKLRDLLMADREQCLRHAGRKRHRNPADLRPKNPIHVNSVSA